MNPTTVQAGTATFLFCDMEGSTRLLQQLGERYAAVLLDQRRLVEQAVREAGGREMGTAGDGCFAVFDRARDAVSAAVCAQNALAAHGWPEGAAVRVRMGLHTGEPVLTGETYIGLDVHRAARIGAAGHGGQVLLSGTTRDLVEADLPPGVELRDLGEHHLRDLPRPERLWQLVIPGLPADFPPLRSAVRWRGNVPAPPTPLLGREEEAEAVRALLLQDAVRLLTLTGPGGTGKTRLAIEVATRLQEHFADGVYFVPLAAVRDPALVPSSVAVALGVMENPGRPVLATVQDHLRTLHVLLVLDNLEQVVDAAPLISRLLASCPRLKVMVTSRVVLRLSGEQEYPVPPLRLPGPEEEPARAVPASPAVALFVQRARAVRPDFALTERNRDAVAAICARLDGLPLAIELAAARVKLFPPEAMLARLDSRLDLLRGGARDQPERHQTLRQAVDWSYQLLDPGEQALFRRLSVFLGGCDLAAASAVCRAAGGLSIDLMDGIAALVDQSLLRPGEGTGDEPRFLMLETIREFGLELLQAAGREDREVRRAHAAHFLALAEEAEPRLTGPDQAVWLDRLEAEHGNLRAALQWAEAQGEVETALRLAVALWRFWAIRGHMHEGRERLERLLALPGLRPPTRARALCGVGAILHELGDLTTALRYLEESAAIFRSLGDSQGQASALNNLGWVQVLLGHLDRAQALSGEALDLCRAAGDARGTAVALNNLGWIRYFQGDFAGAGTVLEEALAVRGQAGDVRGRAYALSNLAWAEAGRGEYARADVLLAEALGVLRVLRDRQLVPNALAMQGFVALEQGDYDRAAKRLEEAIPLWRQTGNRFALALAIAHLGRVRQGQGELDAADAMFAESLTIFRAIGARWALASVLCAQAGLAAARGEHARARALIRESTELRAAIRDHSGLAECLEEGAMLEAAAGVPQRAARLVGTAEALRERLRAPLPPRSRPALERCLASLSAALGAEALTRARAEGRRLSPEQAAAELGAEVPPTR